MESAAEAVSVAQEESNDYYKLYSAEARAVVAAAVAAVVAAALEAPAAAAVDAAAVLKAFLAKRA